MTTDNRTNEQKPSETKSDQTFCFTEAQVEAAAIAMRADTLLCHMNGSAVPFEALARAALVAAQGAAPQAFKPCAHVVCLCTPVLPSSTVDEDALAEAWDRGANDALLSEGYINTEMAAVRQRNPYRADRTRGGESRGHS